MEYNDGYSHCDAEFNVKIQYNKVSLSKKGILGLSIECYSCAYTIYKLYSIHYFRVESDAMEFVDLLNLHSLK